MRILLAMLLASFAVTTAAAQPKPQPIREKMETDDCAKARKRGKDCVLTIEGHEMKGRTPTPDDIGLSGRKFEPPPSLIRLRSEFIQEIVKTAEDL